MIAHGSGCGGSQEDEAAPTLGGNIPANLTVMTRQARFDMERLRLWSVWQHGGRASDRWVARLIAREAKVRAKFDRIAKNARQGGVVMYDGLGQPVAHASHPLLRTRW